MVVDDLDLNALLGSQEGNEPPAGGGDGGAGGGEASPADADVFAGVDGAGGGEAPGQQQSGYVNEFHEYLDQQFRGGASVDEIYHNLQLRRMDVDSMDENSLLREKLRREFPNASVEDLDEYLEETYPDTAAGRMKRAKDAADTRAMLSDLKAKSAEPRAAAEQREQTEAMEQAMSNYSTVATNIVKRMESYDLKLPTEDGKEFAYSFPIPEETREKIARAAAMVAMNENLSLDPKNGGQETVKSMKEQMQAFLFFYHGREIAEAALRDGLAKGVRLAKKGRVNPSGTPPQNSDGRGQGAGDDKPGFNWGNPFS